MKRYRAKMNQGQQFIKNNIGMILSLNPRPSLSTITRSSNYREKFCVKSYSIVGIIA